MRTILICHSPEGQINNVIFDPIPAGMSEHYDTLEIPHVIVETDEDPSVIVNERYILNGEVAERPEFDVPDEITLVADGVDTHTLTLPDPCAIKLDGEPHTIEGGSLPLSADMPAEYRLELVQWPYIKKTVKVIANAPV